MKTKKEIMEEIKNTLRDSIIRKEFAFDYFKQAQGNAVYYTSAMAAENEIKELKKQLEFFDNYKDENLGTDGNGSEREVSTEDVK